MHEDPLPRIAIILVRARNPSNIGAVARAMHDFGLRQLRIVNEFAPPFEAARSAIDASAVLADAVTFPTVAEAVADCTLVLGTTAVGERVLQHPIAPLAEAAASIHIHLAASPEARVALLFGSEKTGLSNDELSHCHALLTIPMFDHPGVRHPSMNLGQAVAVCLYELIRNPTPAIPPSAPTPPSAAILERLTTLLTELLSETEYTRHHPANSDAAQMRRLILRMGLDAADAQVWLGILRQTLWKLRQPK
jgi:TrmH family RNA methyltransferase